MGLSQDGGTPLYDYNPRYTTSGGNPILYICPVCGWEMTSCSKLQKCRQTQSANTRVLPKSEDTLLGVPLKIGDNTLGPLRHTPMLGELRTPVRA